MKVYFEGIGVLFEVNLGLTSRLAMYKDLKITLGAYTPHLCTYGTWFVRHYKNLNIVMTQPPKFWLTGKFGDLVAKMLIRLSFYDKFLSKFDVVHLNRRLAPYSKAAVRIQKPKLLTLHWLPSKIEEDIIKKLDALVSPSKFVQKAVSETLGFRPKVIYHGTDTTLFNTQITKMKARKYLGLPSSKKIVFWNGRLDANKDLKTLIDAIPIVTREIPDSFFVIKGRTMSKYARALLHNSKKYLKKMGTEKKVRWMLGWDLLPKMPYYYRSADVFAHTSLFESFGFVFVEAMACGVPIVACNAATAPEIVGDAGLLFEPKNPEDLADKIVRLLCNDKIKMELSERGLKRISELGLTWKKAAERYRKLYFSLI